MRLGPNKIFNLTYLGVTDLAFASSAPPKTQVKIGVRFSGVVSSILLRSGGESLKFPDILRTVLGESAADGYIADRLQPYVVVVLNLELVRELRLDESGNWTRSNIKNLLYRVDPRNDALVQQRHVHVSHSKHVHSPGEQVAWNGDGTRHDRHNFNSSFKGLVGARELAAKVLGISDPELLEDVDENSGKMHLTEQATDRSKFYYFRLRP